MPRQYIILALLLFLLIIVLGTLYFRKNVEGFGTIYPTRDEFSKSQMVRSKKLNRALYTNSCLEKDIAGAVSAFLITDTLNNNKNGATDISHYFDKDPFPGLAARNQICAGILEPRLLPERDVLTNKGCGWWYVDNDNRASTGADGTELGPYDNDTINISSHFCNSSHND